METIGLPTVLEPGTDNLQDFNRQNFKYPDWTELNWTSTACRYVHCDKSQNDLDAEIQLATYTRTFIIRLHWKYYMLWTECNTDSLWTVSFISFHFKLECGPMPNLMVALPNIGGALCSTPQSLADAEYWSAVQ